ncbi:tetratricopeptide repeat protein, partial [Lysobacter sp. A3-1-A15]
MATFVILAVVLALAALAWATTPLWRQAPVPGAVAVATMAVLAGALYLAVGNPDALDPANRRPPETLPEAIAGLEAALERDPRQPEGWRLLARAYAAEARMVDARDAFSKAVELAPDDADLLAEAAESRALAQPDRRFDDAAVDMLQRALQVQPMHQRSRWFLGIAQRQRGQHAQAAATWSPLLGAVDASTAGPL